MWQRGLRQLVFGALLAPFLLMSLIAAHLMPSHGADGGMVLVICSTDGPKTITIDPATGEPVDEQDHPSASACHWACAGHAVTLTPAGSLPLAERAAVPLCPQIPSFTLTAARATGLPPSTGPPVAA